MTRNFLLSWKKFPRNKNSLTVVFSSMSVFVDHNTLTLENDLTCERCLRRVNGAFYFVSCVHGKVNSCWRTVGSCPAHVNLIYVWNQSLSRWFGLITSPILIYLLLVCFFLCMLIHVVDALFPVAGALSFSLAEDVLGKTGTCCCRCDKWCSWRTGLLLVLEILHLLSCMLLPFELWPPLSAIGREKSLW